jgi:hypothetical protein
MEPEPEGGCSMAILTPTVSARLERGFTALSGDATPAGDGGGGHDDGSVDPAAAAFASAGLGAGPPTHMTGTNHDDLSALPARALCKRAEDMGIDEDAIDRADSMENRKEALIALIKESAEAKAVAAAVETELAQLRAELAPLTARALAKRAEEAGIEGEHIDAADGADDRKAALTDLVVEYHRKHHRKPHQQEAGAQDDPFAELAAVLAVSGDAGGVRPTAATLEILALLDSQPEPEPELEPEPDMQVDTAEVGIPPVTDSVEQVRAPSLMEVKQHGARAGADSAEMIQKFATSFDSLRTELERLSDGDLPARAVREGVSQDDLTHAMEQAMAAAELEPEPETDEPEEREEQEEQGPGHIDLFRASVVGLILAAEERRHARDSADKQLIAEVEAMLVAELKGLEAPELRQRAEAAGVDWDLATADADTPDSMLQLAREAICECEKPALKDRRERELAARDKLQLLTKLGQLKQHGVRAGVDSAQIDQKFSTGGPDSVRNLICETQLSRRSDFEQLRVQPGQAACALRLHSAVYGDVCMELPEACMPGRGGKKRKKKGGHDVSIRLLPERAHGDREFTGPDGVRIEACDSGELDQ